MLPQFFLFQLLFLVILNEKPVKKVLISEGSIPLLHSMSSSYYLIFIKNSKTERYYYELDLTYIDETPLSITYNENAKFGAFSYFSQDLIIGNNPTYTFSVSGTSYSQITTNIQSDTQISLAFYSTSNYMISGGSSGILYIYSSKYSFNGQNYMTFPQSSYKNYIYLDNNSQQSLIATHIENVYILFFSQNNYEYSKILYSDNLLGTSDTSQPYVEPQYLGDWTLNPRRVNSIHLKSDYSIILFCLNLYSSNSYICNFGSYSVYFVHNVDKKITVLTDCFESHLSKYFSLTLVSEDKVVAICSDNENNLMINFITYADNSITAGTQITINTQGVATFPNYGEFNDGGVIFFQQDNKIYRTSININICNDGVLSNIESRSITSLNFNDYIRKGATTEPKYNITSIGTGIKIYKGTSTSVLTANYESYSYSITYDFSFKSYYSETPLTITFKLVENGEDDTCTISINTVKNCCDGCFDCRIKTEATESSSAEYECRACDNDDNYYQIKDATNIICYNSSTITSVGNYYLDSINKYYDSCMISCSTCSSATICDSCNTGSLYYPNGDDENTLECILNPTNGYYFNSNKMYSCPTKCATCEYSDSQVNCLSCSSGYYKVKDSNPIECIIKRDDDNYYISSDNEVTKCTINCLTCSSSTLCTSCNVNSNYYTVELSDTSIQCLIKTTSGYYVDETNKKLIKCTDLNCIECDQNDKCITCKTESGYYLIYGKTDGRCINKDTPGYILKEDNLLYSICDETSCETCVDEGCSECKTSSNYYPAYSESINPSLDCHLYTDPPVGQYWDETSTSFKLCDTGYTTDTVHTQCSKCNEELSYYKVQNISPLECHLESDVGYYISSTDHLLYKCDESCISCENTGNNCLVCNNDDEYYSISEENLPTQCYKKPYNNYYLDGIFWKKCYISCETCSTAGTNVQHNCLTCKSNYVVSTEISGNCNEICSKYYYYDENNVRYCIDNCPSGYYLIEDLKKCDTACPSEYYIIENTKKCISNNCPSGYYLIDGTKNCVESCSEPYYTVQEISKCVILCPSDYYIVEDQKKCLSTGCPHGYYLIENTKNCQTSCPSTYYLAKTVKQCLENCLNQNLKTYLQTCVEICPTNYIHNSATNICEEDLYKKCRIIENEIYIQTSSLKRYLDDLISEYISSYPSLNNIISVRNNINSEYILVIYKKEECLNEISTITPITVSQNCLLKLKTKYRNKISENEEYPFIIIHAEIYNTTTKDIISKPFAIYLNDGSRLDLSICSESGDTYIEYVKVTEENGGNIELAKEMAKLGIDIYNISDPFFHDVCFSFTNHEGDDVSINDRVEYYYQNVNICDENCEYKGINYNEGDDNYGEAECECKIINDFLTEALDNPLTEEIFDVLRTANFELFKCYKQVFNTKNWAKNFGGWIVFFLGLGNITLIIIFIKEKLIKMLSYLERRIATNKPDEEELKICEPETDEIHENNNDDNIKNSYVPSTNENLDVRRKRKSTLKHNNYEIELSNPPIKKLSHIHTDTKHLSLKNPPNQSNELSLTPPKKLKRHTTKKEDTYYHHKRTVNPTKTRKKSSLFLKDQKETISLRKNSDSRTINSRALLDPKKSMSFKKSFESKLLKNNRTLINNNIYDEKISYKEDPNLKETIKYKTIRKLKEPDREIIKKEVKEDEFTEEELNQMPIEDVIQWDKRTFKEFLWAQLVDKQEILNIFFDEHPLESFHIRLILYIYGILLYFFVNALFYIESYISTEIHNKGKKFNFIELISNEVQRCIYSIIVSAVVGVIGGAFEENEKRLNLLIENERYQQRYILQVLEITKNLRIQIKTFLIFNILCLFIFWYYISSFCAVMKGSRVNWLEGSIITFLITELIPVFIALLCTCFRYLGMKWKYGGIFYKFSQFLL